jgi:hypothetical protein
MTVPNTKSADCGEEEVFNENKVKMVASYTNNTLSSLDKAVTVKPTICQRIDHA